MLSGKALLTRKMKQFTFLRESGIQVIVFYDDMPKWVAGERDGEEEQHCMTAGADASKKVSADG